MGVVVIRVSFCMGVMVLWRPNDLLSSSELWNQTLLLNSLLMSACLLLFLWKSLQKETSPPPVPASSHLEEDKGFHIAFSHTLSKVVI